MTRALFEAKSAHAPTIGKNRTSRSVIGMPSAVRKPGSDGQSGARKCQNLARSSQGLAADCFPTHSFIRSSRRSMGIGPPESR